MASSNPKSYQDRNLARGFNEVHDIEEFVKVGKSVRGCPYYAAWSLAENAELVFFPYSYIVNPVIRAGVEVDLKGAIIIFDEAHNMEDIAREAGSVNLDEETLFTGLGSVILEKSTMKTLTIYGKSGSPVDHMSCFGDVARRFQETDLDEATKGKQYIHSCLRFFFLNSEVFLHCLRIHSSQVQNCIRFFSPLVSMTNYLDRSLDDLKLYHAHLLQKTFGMKMRIAAYWPIVLQRIVDSISMHLHLSVNYLVNSRFQTEIIAEMVDFGGGGRVERMLRGDEQEKEIMKSRIGLLKDSVEAIDETIDKEQVGKTTDLANRVIIEISVTRYTQSFRWLQKNDVPTTVNKKRHVYKYSGFFQEPNFLGEFSSVNDDNNSDVIYYMSRRSIEQQKQTMQQQHQLSPSGFGATPSLAGVMQFADFGPKVALNQTSNQDDQETWMDPIYFLKLPVLNDKIEDHNQTHNLMSQAGGECEGNIVNVFLEEKENQDDENNNNSVQLRFTGGEEGNRENKNDLTKELKSKRKRTRTGKTSEEVESQRTTYIALVKGTQLLHCLESQKRQIILGETSNRQIVNMTTTMTSSSPITSVANPQIITGM
ncbi:unnamed protein product [Brassica napus]|uniref:(rape) hypothetical protein n=1 Tax=Brassica napus TaxID=3708 RepID=A0A816LWF2_BRANA|nr:unnamed protein product [Brassica napus]